MTTSTQRPSKADTAYEFIRTGITQGDFKPGERLVIDQIARELSVSPIPVREAIRRLEAEDLVVFRHNAGAQVAGIDLMAYSEEMETLALLEGFATAQAAPGLDEATLAKAEQINADMRAALVGFEPMRLTSLNRDFHVVLCGKCANQHLRAELESQWQRMDRVRRSTFSIVPDRARESIAEHDTLLGLIRCGAPSLAIEVFARQHKLNTLATLKEHARAAAPA